MKKFKRVLAVLTVMAMVITSVPNVFYNTVSAATGPADGQVEYVGGSNSTPAGATYDIAVSKTIKEVAGKENYFDITLKTTTHRHHVDMSTDVVIVMDISNTMNFAPVAGTGSKLDQAKAATNQFIKQFAEDNNLADERRVSVVTFNQNAQVVVPLKEANDTNDYLNNFEKQVKDITAPTEPIEIKFTNIEGGLQLANNILANSGSKYKFVILLTDGFPTTYIKSGKTSQTKIYGYDTYMSHTSDYSSYKSGYVGKNTNGTLKKPGYMANVSLKKPCLYGVDYSDYGAQRAQATAQAMKKSGMNIFSVGIGIGGMSIANYLKAHEGKVFSTVDTNGMGSSYVIGTSTDSYKAWLGNSIAGGNQLTGSSANRYAPGDSATQLAAAYTNILKTIEEAPETTMREFYTLDPMSDVADFIGFYDKNGKLASNPNKLVGESKQNAENTAVYGGTGNADRINWNMLQSGYTMDGQNLVFTLKYRVRLMNESSGFKWSSAYDMNKKTTLNYSQKYSESGEDVPDGTGVLEYPIPETEGYKGYFSFHKVDGDTNKALEGIKFTLRHHAAGCTVCGGDATIKDMTAVSGAGGAVEFKNIPSGHEYWLMEDEPESYAPVHDSTIIVSYGETYLGTKTSANKLVNGKLNGGTGNEFIIENTKVEPVELKLQVSKTMDGNTPAEGAFQFQMEGKHIDGSNLHEVVSNNASGKAVFKTLTYDAAGTYEYVISEIAGTDTGIVYDGTKHKVKVEVSKTNDGKAYQAKVSVDGKSPVTFVAKDNVVETADAGTFANKTRSNASIKLEAEKKLIGGTPAAGQFTFDLKAITENAPVPLVSTAVNNTAGKAEFGTIVYETPGVYEYEISEAFTGDKSVVYDAAKYKAVVTVTAPADLTKDTALQAAVKYYDTATNEEVTAAAFTNKYKEIPEITMKGFKSMNGKPAASGAFTFVFQEVDDSGNPVGEAVEIKNNDKGIIDFDAALADVVNELIKEINAEGNTTGVATARNFKIYEKAGSEANVEYDDTYYVLQVGAFAGGPTTESYNLTAIMQKVDGTVIESPFRVEASPDINVVGANGVILVKFDNTSKVELDLNATKVLQSEGATLGDGDFTFVLEGSDGIIEKVKNDKDGNIKFTTLEYTAADVGSHSYVIYEEEGTDRGLYYDDSLYTVNVEVTMDEHGNLSISDPEIIDEYDEHFTEMGFLNKDMDPTHLHLKAVKTVNDSMPTVAQTFEFELVNADTGKVIETIRNVHETVAFSGLHFDETGTFNYIVREVVPASDDDPDKEGIQKDGFTYDQTEYAVKVVVTDANDDGILEKVVTIDGKEDPVASGTAVAGSFENTYEAESVSVDLNGNKVLTGRDLTAGEFGFAVEAVTKDAPMPADNTAQNDKKGAFVFDSITFDKPGTYEYTVKEVIPADAENNIKDGVEYDTAVYNVVITVTDNGKGQLVAEKTVNGSADTAIAFKNTYDALPTAVQFHADKYLSGRALQAGEFEFRLVEVDAAGNEIAGTEQIIANGTNYSVGTGKIFFKSIIYTEPGTHTYKLSEVIPAEKQGGIKYDTTVHTINVDVADNGKGHLVGTVNGTAAVIYDAGDFNNKYEPTPTGITLEATKELSGRDWSANDEFTFNLAAADDVTKKAVKDGVVTIAKDKAVTTKDNRSVKFDGIEFTKAGEYNFVITENAGSAAGMVYDTHELHAAVTVTDDGKGQLTAAVAYVGEQEFINEFSPENVKVSLDGKKVLTGRGLNEGEFAFTIEAVTNGAPLPAIAEVTNAADGTVKFGEITYTGEGTYEYLIKEKASGLPGVTDDTTPVKAIVKVEYDSAAGVYKANVSYDKNGKNDFVFNNEYKAASVDISIDAVKTVTPSEGNSFTMEAGMFNFEIEPADFNPASDPITQHVVTHDKDGNINFDAEYTEAGTYMYTLHEASGEHRGIIFDDAVYHIEVIVKDDVSAGRMTADVNVTKDGKAVDKIVFNNGYNPQKTSAEIHGHKHLTGKALEDGEFSFSIKALTEGAPMPAETTVKNQDTGVFQFPTIVYDKVGVYEYEVSEVNEGKAGIIYDGSKYKVTVTVTDENGKLNAKVDGVYTSEHTPVIVYNNTYKPASTAIAIDGQKALTGRALNEGEFTFELRDADGSLIDEAVNSAAGTFAFDSITFDEAGTYTYTVAEKNEKVKGITYDARTYGVTVVVEDAGGALRVKSVDYTENGTAVEGIVFSNAYEPAPTSIQPGAMKVMEGCDLKAGEFTFVLEDESGNKVYASNDADGAVVFDEIKYTEEGTYKYKIYEAVGDDENVIYDEAVYEITVVVTDNQIGDLNAEVIEGTLVPTFVNTYDEPDEPGTPDEPGKPGEPGDSDETSDGGTQTGDDFNGGLYGFLALAALAVAGAAVRRRKTE